MARSPYKHAKRQKELAKKKKQEEKRQRKQEKKEQVDGAPLDEAVETDVEAGEAGEAGEETSEEPAEEEVASE